MYICYFLRFFHTTLRACRLLTFSAGAPSKHVCHPCRHLQEDEPCSWNRLLCQYRKICALRFQGRGILRTIRAESHVSHSPIRSEIMRKDERDLRSTVAIVDQRKQLTEESNKNVSKARSDCTMEYAQLNLQWASMTPGWAERSAEIFQTLTTWHCITLKSQCAEHIMEHMRDDE